MFTGLVETVGSVIDIRASGGVTRLTIQAPACSDKLKYGESISVSGACLTVVQTGATSFAAEMMEETVGSTRLGSLRIGDRVNLERPMKADSRFDGHIVAGHVDEVGRVEKIEKLPGSDKVWISVSKKLLRAIAPKGSVVVDGVSLTVVDSTEDRFSVGLIPTTRRETTIGFNAVGDDVNIEIDMIARCVIHYLAGAGDEERIEKPELTWARLSEYGW